MFAGTQQYYQEASSYFMTSEKDEEAAAIVPYSVQEPCGEEGGGQLMEMKQRIYTIRDEVLIKVQDNACRFFLNCSTPPSSPHVDVEEVAGDVAAIMDSILEITNRLGGVLKKLETIQARQHRQ